MKNKIAKLSIATFMLTLTFTGCSTKDIQVAELQKQVQAQKEKISSQQKSVDDRTAEVISLQKELEESKNIQTPHVETSKTNSSKIVDESSLTPPNAIAGECYAKVLTPAEYETTTEEKLLTSSIEKLRVTEPTYKTVEYSILDKAESFKYVLVPATYKCVQNRVMVEPEKTTYKIIPATFREVEETIMISPAQQVWKKGKGPITKIDNHTGDIMCLIEEPAQYKTVKTQVVDEPARTEKIIIPAVYSNIKAKEVATEASYEKVIIPATYKIITVQELVTEAEILTDSTPETYQTITTTAMSKAEELKWERILCETNTNGNVVKKIQQSLADKSYNPGVIDGIYGRDTQKALTAFQIDNNLASGALTLESLDALGAN